MHKIWSILAANAGQVLGDAGMTVLIGLVVVFAALILLTLIFVLFGRVASAGSRSKQEEKPAAPAPVSKAAPVAASPAPVPQVQSGISEEVVAAIAAAVACMTPDGKRYAVRSVRRAGGDRSAWAAAGLAESTRPF